jgi:ornithine cyclodeaminase/alanine dehydrogenase-like protein (mu-crystallin family)
MTDPVDSLLYLARADVIALCAEIDAVDVVADVLVRHASGATTLPAEAYLPWRTVEGADARSLALPGAVWGPRPAIGLKVINSSLGNPDAGRPRAGGLTMVFDRDRAYPVAVMEAAYLSALRTVAYTVLSVRLLAAVAPARIAIIGCGAIGEQHARVLAERYPNSVIVLHDRRPERTAAVRDGLRTAGVAVEVAGGPREAVAGAQLVVTATTTTTPYLSYEWLSPGALVTHVSLDDVEPEVVALADVVVVDDWDLVRADDRRLLGRLYRAGALAGPAGDMAGPADGAPAPADGKPARPPRRVDASLGDVIVGRHPGRTDDRQIVLSNPFGMGILDVALADAVHRRALSGGVGIRLPR